MKWIKPQDRLPEDKNSFDVFLVVIEWLDTFLDKGTKKRFVDTAYFDVYHKLFVNKPENTLIEDENTKIIYWAELPESPTD